MIDLEAAVHFRQSLEESLFLFPVLVGVEEGFDAVVGLGLRKAVAFLQHGDERIAALAGAFDVGFRQPVPVLAGFVHGALPMAGEALLVVGILVERLLGGTFVEVILVHDNLPHGHAGLAWKPGIAPSLMAWTAVVEGNRRGRLPSRNGGTCLDPGAERRVAPFLPVRPGSALLLLVLALPGLLLTLLLLLVLRLLLLAAGLLLLVLLTVALLRAALLAGHATGAARAGTGRACGSRLAAGSATHAGAGLALLAGSGRSGLALLSKTGLAAEVLAAAGRTLLAIGLLTSLLAVALLLLALTALARFADALLLPLLAQVLLGLTAGLALLSGLALLCLLPCLALLALLSLLTLLPLIVRGHLAPQV